uniref:Macroctenin 2 3 Tachykinin-like peptide 1bv3 n=1 Tax=Macroctenus kingsleyi TaxID=1747366 RepID=A0A8D7ZRF7_9ARAC|nr:Macroctenin 2 3 Tachykinin-like peptide 1bv3 precursor [Macroctenus kingsleyi]
MNYFVITSLLLVALACSASSTANERTKQDQEERNVRFSSLDNEERAVKESGFHELVKEGRDEDERKGLQNIAEEVRKQKSGRNEEETERQKKRKKWRRGEHNGRNEEEVERSWASFH